MKIRIKDSAKETLVDFIGLIVLLAMFGMVFSVFAMMSNATSLNKDVEFKYKGVKFKTGSFDYKGRLYVPIRTISNQFDYEVTWDAENKEIKVSNYRSYILFNVGSTLIRKHTNCQTDFDNFYMDVVPLLIDGRTYLPIRFALEPLDKVVKYSETKTMRTVNITDKLTYQGWWGMGRINITDVTKKLRTEEEKLNMLILALISRNKSLQCDVVVKQGKKVYDLKELLKSLKGEQ